MKERNEKWVVKTDMISHTSGAVLLTEKGVDLEIELGIKYNEARDYYFGWFEMDGGEDWYAEGNIDIEDGSVTGYDGVFELSSEIVAKLEEWGYDCSEL